MGEDTDGMVESTSKLRDYIKALTGVDIMKNEKEFKDLYTIMDQIGQKWDELSDVDQQALLEKISGKTQANVIASVLQNVDTLEKAYGEAMNSEGSAEEEQEHFTEGMQYHINQMTVAWQDFSHAIVDSDIAKTFIDIGTAVVSLLAKLQELTGVGPEVAAIMGLNGLRKAGGLATIADNFGDWLSLATGHGPTPTNEDTANEIYRLLGVTIKDKDTGLDRHLTAKELFQQASINLNDNNKTFQLSKQGQEYIKSLIEAREAGQELTASQKEVIAGLTKTGNAFEQAGNFALSFGKSLLVTAGWTIAINAIGLLIKKLYELSQAEKTAIENGKKAMSNLKEMNATYSEHVKTVNDVKDKYVELKKGVDFNGNNISLTTDQYKEFLDINNQLADMFPSLSRTYDENGNALVNLGNNAETVSEQLQNLLKIEQQANNQKIVDEYLPDIVAKTKVEAKNAQKEIKKTETQQSNYQKVDLGNDKNGKSILAQYLYDFGIGNDLSKYKQYELLSQTDEGGNVLITGDEDLNNAYKEALAYAFNGYTKAYDLNNGAPMWNKRPELEDRINAERNDVMKRMDEAVNKYFNGFTGMTEELAKKAQQEKSDYDAVFNDTRYAMNAYLQSTNSFQAMDQNIQSEANTLMNNVDWADIYNKNKEASDEDTTKNLEEYVKNNIIKVTQALAGDDELNKEFVGLLSGEDALVNGSYNVQDYLKTVDDFMNKVKTKFKDNQSAIDLFDSIFNNPEKQLDQVQRYNYLIQNTLSDLVRKQKGIDKNGINANGEDSIGFNPSAISQQAQAIIDSLSDVDQAMLLSSDMTSQYIEEMSDEYDNTGDLMNAVVQRVRNSAEALKQTMADLATQGTNLTTISTDSISAITEQNNQGYLSNDTISKMKSELEALGYSTESVATAFEHVYGGMRLDNQMFNVMIHNGAKKYITELTGAYQELNHNYDDQNKRLVNLKGKLEDAKKATKGSTECIDENSDAVNNNVKKYEDEIKATEREIATTEEQMAKYEKLIDQYDQMNNAYQRLTNALSSPNQGARYDTVRDAKDQVEKLAKNNQWGTDDVIEWINYWTGVDTTDASLDEEARMYKVAAANAKKYSTEDYTGVKNLYTDITSLASSNKVSNAYAVKDEFGNETHVKSMTYDQKNDVLQINDIKKAAEDTGLSVSALVDTLDKMKEFKLNVKYDSAQAGMAKVEESAEELETKLKDLETQKALKLMVDPKMDTESLDKQIKEAQRELEINRISLRIGIDTTDLIAQVVDAQDQIKQIQNDSDLGEEDKQERIDKINKKWKSDLKDKGVTDKEIQNIELAFQTDGEQETEDAITKVQNMADEQHQLNLKTSNADTALNAFQFNLNNVLNKFDSQYELKFKAHYLGLVGDVTDNIDATTKWDGQNNGGNAHANGQNVNGKTLVGELGEEIRYSPTTGKWDMLGTTGPQLRDDIKPDDIIFNHKQTQSIIGNKTINPAQSSTGSNATLNDNGNKILVRNGKWTLTSNNILPQPNDIVFNGKQTNELLSNGTTNTRGQAFAQGNAFIGGNAFDPPNATGKNVFSDLEIIESNRLQEEAGLTNVAKDAAKNVQKNTDATNDNTDAIEKETKKFDWASQALKMMQKRRSWVANKANDSYASYDDRIASSEELREHDQNLISAANDYYNIKYKELGEADAKVIELFGEEQGNDIITKARNGDLSIQDYLMKRELDPLPENATEEQKKQYDETKKQWDKQNDAIQEEIDAMDSLTDAIDQQFEMEEQAREDEKKLYELQIDRIQNVIDDFGQKISHIETTINIKNTAGRIVTAGDYNSMIDASKQQVDAYYDQIATMQDRLQVLSEDSEDSEEYYSVLSSINQAKNAIDQCVQSQYEWAEAIASMPITHIEAYINNIKTAQSALDDYVSELEAAGKKINADVLKQGVDIQKKLAEEYSAEIELLQEKIKNYTPGSDQWNSTFLAIQSVADAISDVNQKLIDYNKQLLAIPVDKLTDTATQLKNIKDGLDEIQNDNLTIINTAISIIEKNAEDLTKPLEEQLKLLQQQNQARQDELNLEQQKYALAKANEQRNIQVVDENGRLTWAADDEAIRNAQNGLADAEAQKKQNDLQRQIDKINDDAQKQEEKWQKIQSDSQYNVDLENAAKLAGMSTDEFENRIKTVNDEDIYNKTKTSYDETAERQNNISKMSDDLDKVVTLLQQINDMYTKGTITSAQAQTMYNNVISRSANGFTGQEYYQSRLETEQKSSTEQAIADTTKQIANTKGELYNNYKSADDVKKLIDKYSKSYDELTKKITDLIALATEAYKNTKDAEDVAYNVSGYGGNSGSSWGSVNSDESKKTEGGLHPTSVYQGSYKDSNGYTHDVYRAYDRHGRETNGYELYDTGATSGKNLVVNYLDENGNVAYSKDYGSIVTKKYVTGVRDDGTKYGYNVDLTGSNQRFYSPTYNKNNQTQTETKNDTPYSSIQTGGYVNSQAQAIRDYAKVHGAPTEPAQTSQPKQSTGSGSSSRGNSNVRLVTDTRSDGSTYTRGDHGTMTYERTYTDRHTDSNDPHHAHTSTVTRDDRNGIGPGFHSSRYAEGIEEGAVKRYASSTFEDERVKLLKLMGTTDIDSKMIPVIAHEGEVVLNAEQQARLLNNFAKVATVPNDAVSNASSVINNTPVSISMGNIELHEVQDVNGLANAITQQFEPAMAQAFSKTFKK